MKRVKIIHSGFSDTCWYNKMLKQDFKLLRMDENQNYVVEITPEKTGIVERVDGEVIEEEIKTHPVLQEHLENLKTTCTTKNSVGKLYYELDFSFIKLLAERMAKNKGEIYKRYEWKKGIDVEETKQALLRHSLAIMEGNYKDDGEEFGHLAAVAINSMFIVHELKRQKDE